jgi:WD40 repeat protein
MLPQLSFRLDKNCLEGNLRLKRISLSALIITGLSLILSVSLLPKAFGLNAARMRSVRQTLMTVGSSTTPFISTYRTSTMGKIPTPAATPSGVPYGVAYNKSGSLMALAIQTTPYINIYDTKNWSKLADPGSLPPGAANGVAFSKSGAEFLAVAHAAIPYVTIYNVSSWAKLTNVTTSPTGAGNAVAFSPDGTRLAVANGGATTLTVYNTANGTGGGWAKLANPIVLPTGTAFGIAFNPAGTLCAVAHATTPFVTIYSTASTPWTKLTDPSPLPASQGNSVAFSPDGSYLVVGQNNSPYLTIYRIPAATSLDTATWTTVTPSTSPAGTVYGVAFNAQSSILGVAHTSSPFVSAYDTSNWSILPSPSVLPPTSGPNLWARAISFNPR